LDPNNQWFEKLDLLEFIIRNMNDIDPSYASHLKNQFVLNINREFERLSYSYRIIDDLIVEVTSESEINAINDAIEKSTENIKIHLSNALQSLAIRPKPDCRTSIKESISAVEALCRQLTGANTYGEALNELKKQGLEIPRFMYDAFIKLYTYTNQPDNGIRHALLETDNLPEYPEALFMLVTCSSFINYIDLKRIKSND
jgi:hypothetical protein